MEVQFVESKNLKEKPTGALGFGKYYTDYMFVMDWDAGQEWHDARVVPYGPLNLIQQVWYCTMHRKHLKV